MKLPVLKTTAAGFLCLLSLAAVAETQLEREEIVVTATRSELLVADVPVPVIVVDAEEISRSTASTTADLLRGLGAISVADFYGDGSATRISIRGFGDTAANNVLILVDGRRLNNTDLGAPNINVVPLSSVERIEIIQDSSAVLYGDQAVGGVVNIITKQGYDGASINVGFGSNGTRKLSVDGALNNSAGLFASAAYADEESDGYRDNSAFDYRSGSATIGAYLGNHEISVNAIRTEEERRLPGALSLAEAEATPRKTNKPKDAVDTDTIAYRFKVLGPVTGDLSYEIDATKRNESQRSVSAFGPYDIDRQVHTATPRLHYATNQWRLSFGVDVERADQENSFSNGRIEQDSDAIFLRGTYGFESVDVTAGYRAADFKTRLGAKDISEDLWAAELGAVWSLSHNLDFSLRAERNFRVPNLDEQGFTPNGETLEAQTGESYSAGLDWATPTIETQAQLWHMKQDNELIYDPTEPNSLTFSGFGANRNLPPTKRSGLTVTNKFALTAATELLVSGSAIVGEISEGRHAGNDIPGVARWQAKVAVDQTVTEALSLRLEADAIGKRRQYDDLENKNAKLDSHTVWHLGASWQQQSYNFSLSIRNVLDEGYIEYAASNGYYPSPDRTVWFACGLDF